jgi:hypothetical protein
MRPFIKTDVRIVETEELQKTIASDLQVPDPIITPKKEKVNENSKKHDGRASGVNDNPSISPSGE